MTLSRVFKDATQAARGRRAARYEIEVIPYFCGEIPDNVQRVLFAWERGTKLFVTDAEKVNPNTHAVFFKQYLRQKVTIYMEGHDVKAKEFSFKIQAVTKGSKGEDERKTIGKVKVDLAQYCDGQVNPEPQDLFLQCKPVGKLKVSVKAVWLKDDSVDPDALTEAGTELTDWTEASATGRSKKAGPGRSNMSKKKQPQQAQEEEEDGEEDAHADEQDLSGFDHHHRDGSSVGHHDGQQGNGEEEGRGPRSGKGRRHRHQALDEDGIPEGQEPGEEEGEEQPHPRSSEPGEGQAASTKGQGGPGKSAAGAEEEYITEGDRIHKPSWRDYVCCCCGPHPMVADVHEMSNLLSEKQATAMDQMNDTTPVEHKKKRKKKRRHHHPEDAAAGGAGAAGLEADAAPQAHPARQPTPQRQTQRQQRPGHER